MKKSRTIAARMSEKKLTLLKFGAPWCGPCRQLAKAKTLETFTESHKDVALKIVDLNDDDDATEQDKANEALADRYGVQAIPTMIFVDSEGEELARSDEATTLKGLEKLYQTAVDALDD